MDARPPELRNKDYPDFDFLKKSRLGRGLDFFRGFFFFDFRFSRIYSRPYFFNSGYPFLGYTIRK